MAITLVEEGEQVVLNCTPTVNRTVTFTAPPPSMDMFSPVNNVLIFPAELRFGGLYRCRFDIPFSQSTVVAIIPGNFSPPLPPSLPLSLPPSLPPPLPSSLPPSPSPFLPPSPPLSHISIYQWLL